MEVEHNNSTEQNTSMEELKVEEDENIKDTSLEEDILGTQSLLMSESDEENNEGKDKTNESPFKISSKQTKRILDSDEEEANPIKVEDNSIKINKKISVLIDSESEEESYTTEDTTKHVTIGLINKESEVAEDINKIDFKELKQDLKKKSRKKSKKLALDNVVISNKKSKKSFGEKLVSDLDDTDNECEDRSISPIENGSEIVNLKNNNNEVISKGKSKTVRASAKKALDEMKAIQSEQQRLHREAHISVPYHKPKKHTLDEFLKRRTIIQPSLSTTNGSPVSTAVQTKRLKMTTEELEEYAKLMEERAKEATEFFRSESESEEEVLKDNEGVLNKPLENNQDNEDVLNAPLQNNQDDDQNFMVKETLNLSSERIIQDILESNDQTDYDIMNKGNENLKGVKITEDELTQILAEQKEIEEKNNDIYERPSCSRVLITEVIELPKLDMNTVRISPVKKPTPRSSFNIKELLKEKNLSGSPSLSGDPNKLIDLETGDLIEKKPTGIENLMKRLMATVKHKKLKTTETCSILSVENGKLEVSKVNISLTEAKDVQKDPKPRAAYFELKKNLKEIIKKKRLNELNKKQEDDLEYSKCLADDDDYETNEYEDEEKIKAETEEYEFGGNKSKSKVIVVDEEENALVVEGDDEDEKNEEVEDDESVVELNSDEENQDNVEDNDNDSEGFMDNDIVEEDNSSENEEDITHARTKQKHRIIKTFDDSDEEDDKDDIDFLKTQPSVAQPLLFETQASQKTSLDDEETELMALCSGTFDATQKSTANAALMSQIPHTNNNGHIVNNDELIELCSGSFDQPTEEPQSHTQTNNSLDKFSTKCNKILSSDDEENEDELKEISKQRIKKLTKKIKKSKTKLGFSDDEDEDEEEIDCDEKLVEDETYDECVAEDEPETFVDYDSEENEILVHMTKQDKVIQAQNFVENEAELSESEWGSADEDEKNLDKYDVELGDEDEFDREKLRTELGKIHARKMLDEDIREVRKIQELLFEDEEKDGVGRQRTFKWKMAESGFNLDDDRQPEEGGEGVNGDSDDEISEHQWRKIRYEREQFLKEQGLKPDSQGVSTILPSTTIPSINSTVGSTITTKKLHIISSKQSKVSINDSKKSSPFLISKGVTTMNKKSVRGSFLVRDKETLNKLAGLTKGASSSIVSSEMDDTASTVSIKSVKPRNFVFATLTEEEHENLKRKADDSLNSSSESGKNFMKKPKLEPRRDKCLIDQLL